MDTPQEANDVQPEKTNSEGISPKGIAAMQGEVSSIDTAPKIEDKPNPEPAAPAPPEVPPPPAAPSDSSLREGPQVGVGEIGLARKIETGVEKPETTLFTITEEEAKKAKEKEMYHSGGPEGGY
jgi:hypothetical protein